MQAILDDDRALEEDPSLARRRERDDDPGFEESKGDDDDRALDEEPSPERARLVERLVDYSLVEHAVEPDGNCQFRALAQRLFGNQELHAVVRAAVVKQLRAASDAYCGFVYEDYEAYACRMAQAREWGDHVTLQAAADAYGVKITVVTSYAEKSFIQVKPTLDAGANGCASPTAPSLLTAHWRP